MNGYEATGSKIGPENGRGRRGREEGPSQQSTTVKNLVVNSLKISVQQRNHKTTCATGKRKKMAFLIRDFRLYKARIGSGRVKKSIAGKKRTDISGI